MSRPGRHLDQPRGVDLARGIQDEAGAGRDAGSDRLPRQGLSGIRIAWLADPDRDRATPAAHVRPALRWGSLPRVQLPISSYSAERRVARAFPEMTFRAT